MAASSAGVGISTPRPRRGGRSDHWLKLISTIVATALFGAATLSVIVVVAIAFYADH